MRVLALLSLILGAAVLNACAPAKTPPTGRWIGNYDVPGVMVDARLEIQPDGRVRVSAPNLVNVTVNGEAQRVVLHAKLAAQLDRDWRLVEPRKMDFDGKVFRKPGGVAPQMEWNPETKTMILVFYFGMHKAVRITMQPVESYADDPWAQT